MRALIFDTETTGLVKPFLPIERQPEIIEYYGEFFVFRRRKKPQRGEAIHSLFKPSKSISDEITRITGIGPQDVAGAPRFEKYAELIARQISLAEVVIGHNVRFDIDMLSIEMERCGIKLQWPRIVCTVEQTMHLRGHRLKLSEAYQLVTNKTLHGAHRADVDVLAVAEIVDEFFQNGMFR